MGRQDDLRRLYQQGAETAPLDRSRFTTPLDRSSAVEQEGLEVDDRQNVIALTKAVRRLLKDPGKYKLTEVQDNMNAYLANMAESWGAIRSDVLGEDTINSELEEQTNTDELGKLFENMMTQLLAQEKRQVGRWQAGERNAILLIDTLITSYTLLGDEARERVNRFIKKLYDASRKF